MEVIPKQEEEEEVSLTSNNVNVLQTSCSDADNDTLSAACLFVIAPWCLDLDVSCDYCCSSLQNFLRLFITYQIW